MAQERAHQADSVERRGQLGLPERVAPVSFRARLTRELAEAEMDLVAGGNVITVPPTTP